MAEVVNVEALYANEKYNNYRGTNLDNEYIIEKPLNPDTNGSFGTVSLYKDINDGKLYAVKKMVLTDNIKIGTCFNDLEMSIKITETLCGIDNNKLICLKNHYLKGNELYLVMEYYEQSIDLFEFMYNLQFTNNISNPNYSVVYLKLINAIMLLLYNGIKIMHDNGILHLDIKLENILVLCNRKLTFNELISLYRVNLNISELIQALELDIRIIDFGFSCDVSQDNCRKPCGTIYYVSPEMYNKNLELGPHSDIYSLGILFFFMIFQIFPYLDDLSISDENRKLNIQYIYKNVGFWNKYDRYKFYRYWYKYIQQGLNEMKLEDILNMCYQYKHIRVYNNQSVLILENYFYNIIYPSLMIPICDRITIDEIIELLSF